jgi:hypothetical protein
MMSVEMTTGAGSNAATSALQIGLSGGFPRNDTREMRSQGRDGPNLSFCWSNVVLEKSGA